MKMNSYYKENDGMLWKESPEDGGYIWRYDGNPLFDMQKNEFWHICNSAVVIKDGKYVGIFRVETKEVCIVLLADLVTGQNDNIFRIISLNK